MLIPSLSQMRRRPAYADQGNAHRCDEGEAEVLPNEGEAEVYPDEGAANGGGCSEGSR